MLEYLSRLHHSMCLSSSAYTETELGTQRIRDCSYPDYDESHQYGLWHKYRLFLYLTNPDNSHWTLHGMYRSEQAAIIVHIDSLNGNHDYFKKPLQHHLQWMTTPDRHPHTPRDASQDQFLHITVPYQRNNYMCGSYALSYHKLLLEHAQTVSSYPALTPTAFASRLRRELQELLTVVTVTYANDYRTWANDQLRRANPTPTLSYPLFPRRSTIAYHEPAQYTGHN